MTPRMFLRVLVLAAMVVAMSAQGVSAGAQSLAEVPIGTEGDDVSEPPGSLPWSDPDERNGDRGARPPAPSDDTVPDEPSDDGAPDEPSDDVGEDESPGHEVRLFAPTVTVTPDTDLHHLDVVTVEGSGYSPGAFIGVAQCRADSVDLDGCDLGTTIYADADGTGSWSVSMTVRRIVGVAGVAFDCNTPPGCAVGAANLDSPGYSEAAAVAITFADVPPPPPPVVTVDPDTDLTHLQPVTIDGSDFEPFAPIWVSQCLADMSACNWGGAFGVTDGDGNVTVDGFRVQRVVGVHGGDYVDCLDSPCVLSVQGQSAVEWVDVPLHFANVPLPPSPTVTVSPATGLTDGQTVQVQGSGYGAGLEVVVLQCSIDSSFFDFRCNFGPILQVAPDGSFTTSLTVSSTIDSWPAVDCTQPSACVVAAFSYDDVLSIGGAPIAFGATEPPAPPPGGNGGEPGGTGRQALAMTGTSSAAVWVGLALLAFGLLASVSARIGRRRFAEVQSASAPPRPTN